MAKLGQPLFETCCSFKIQDILQNSALSQSEKDDRIKKLAEENKYIDFQKAFNNASRSVSKRMETEAKENAHVSRTIRIHFIAVVQTIILFWLYFAFASPIPFIIDSLCCLILPEMLIQCGMKKNNAFVCIVFTTLLSGVCLILAHVLVYRLAPPDSPNLHHVLFGFFVYYISTLILMRIQNRPSAIKYSPNVKWHVVRYQAHVLQQSSSVARQKISKSCILSSMASLSARVGFVDLKSSKCGISCMKK